MRIIILITLVFSASCGTPKNQRYPLAPPLWVDHDRHHVSERPAKYYSGLITDAADQTAFRPLAKMWTFPRSGIAQNATAFDEVANSSWFTNRIGFHNLTPEQLARAACGDRPTLSAKDAPWQIVAAKPNGANPGFFIKAADGTRYLLKFDGPIQPTRGTGSDVIGSKFYWAFGYFTPCNEIIHFNPEILQIAPDATAENIFGEDVPITEEDINNVLSMALRRKDGLLRASASRFLPGRPIGPWTYQGTRSDDPNDVIPHEDRRELRGARVFASWINHFDSREQNTLDVWMDDDGKQFLRHYYIDFGDSLGGRQIFDGLSRRLGRSYYLDGIHILVDTLSFGWVPRRWHKVKLNKFEMFGYFEAEHFAPSKWKAGYPNPAFNRMDYRDALWATRILSYITPAHIRAVVETAEFTDPRHTEFVVEMLIARQKRIFEEYLTKYDPLSSFTLVRRGKTPDPKAQSLCFEDLAVLHDVADPQTTYYKIRVWHGELLDQPDGWLQFTPDQDHPHRSCLLMPIGHRRPADRAPSDALPDDPRRYQVVEIFVHQKPTVPPTSAVRIHLYDQGPEHGFVMAGIERPPRPVVPDLY